MKENNRLTLTKKKSLKKRIVLGLFLSSMIILYVFSFYSQDFTVSSSEASPATILYRLFVVPLINPSFWNEFPAMIGLMMETIAIAYAGVITASFIALPLSVLAAKNSGGRFYYAGKFILNAIRAVPELLFGVLFVGVLGPGPFAGVVAISINSIGMIGKLYAEEIESIDQEPLEAIKASGGNRIQAFWYGILPQLLPQFLSISLFRFEIDVRAATVLGLVGAGGIGVPLILSQQQRHWEQVGVILIIVILFVLIIDKASAAIRDKLVK